MQKNTLCACVIHQNKRAQNTAAADREIARLGTVKSKSSGSCFAAVIVTQSRAKLWLRLARADANAKYTDPNFLDFLINHRA